MESGKKFLNSAGIIMIIQGFLISIASSIPGIIYLGIGAAILIFSSQPIEENYSKYRTLIFVSAVVLILFSPIASILLFVARGEFEKSLANAPPESKKAKRKEDKVSKEVRKIDLLLKLGVLMVSISGLLFATTKWDIITGFMKCLVLLFISIVFLFLYKYTKDKLKLVKSSNSYFVLGITFLILSFVAMIYFETLGNWFTYYGDGKYLAYSLTFGIIGILTRLIVEKTNLKKAIYLAYITLYMSLYCILRFCFIDGALICFVLELISFSILLILKKEEKHPLYKFNKLLGYLYIILIIFTANNYLSIPCEIMGIGILIYLLGKDKDKTSGILVPILINCIVMVITSVSAKVGTKDYVYILLANLVYWIMSTIKDKGKFITITNDIIYNLSMIMFISWATSSATKLIAFLAASIYLIITLIVSKNLIKLDTTSISKYASILAIFMFITSFINFLGTYISFDTGISTVFVVLAYCLMHSIIGNKSLKTTYLVFIYIVSYIGLLVSLSGNLTSAIASIVGLGYLVRYYFKAKKESKANVFGSFNFVLLLVSIFSLFVNCNFLEMPKYFDSLLVVWIYLIILYFLKDESKKKLLLVTVVIPISSFISNLEFLVSNSLILILYDLLIFYVVYIVSKYIIVDKKKLNFWVCLGVIFALLYIIFYRDLAIALYVGIISLIVMFIGYYKEEVKSLFKLGMIAIIFNIFYQLYDVLKMIPFWIYLLVVGLGLIAFVTIKETKKLDINVDEEKK